MKDTSLFAYSRIKDNGIDQNHRDIIIKSMISLKEPAISEVISVRCNLDYHQVARRLSELERMGLVRHTPLKGVTSSGGTARKWSLTSTQLVLEV